MLAISLCLSGSIRSDVEAAFSQSLTAYLECNAIRFALRSQIYCCRALLSIDPLLHGKDAALKFDRLSCDIVAQETFKRYSESSAESEAIQHELWVGLYVHIITLTVKLISDEIVFCTSWVTFRASCYLLWIVWPTIF